MKLPVSTGQDGDHYGIYAHYPFCVRRCAYCDFNVFTPSVIPQKAYTEALTHELLLRSEGLGGRARTLYLGGGTPSLWDAAQLERFVSSVHRQCGLSADAEITLEANPTEVNAPLLQGLRTAGVNRVSLGVQALDDGLLAAIGRRHDATCARRAIELVAEAGFSSYSIDLMFGLPGQSLRDWRLQLEDVLRFEIPHLSVYALTVEPRTPLARQIALGRAVAPDDALQADMLMEARRILSQAGYCHYEVSSYALPGHIAIHNSAYWQQRPYLGLGAGAHGFVAPKRWENIRSWTAYMKTLRAGELPTAHEELLTSQTLMFESIMTGLRRLDLGVDLGAHFDAYATNIADQVDLGNLWCEGTRICLTEQGLRYMDTVLLALLPESLSAV